MFATHRGKRWLVPETKQLQMRTACIHSLSLKLHGHCFPALPFILPISSFLGFEWLVRYFQTCVYKMVVVTYRGSYNNNMVYYPLSQGVVTGDEDRDVSTASF